MEHNRRAALGDAPLDVGDGLQFAFRDGDTSDVAAPEKLESAVIVAQENGDIRARCQKRRDEVRPD
jgi:hypothetical protein